MKDEETNLEKMSNIIFQSIISADDKLKGLSVEAMIRIIMFMLLKNSWTIEDVKSKLFHHIEEQYTIFYDFYKKQGEKNE